MTYASNGLETKPYAIYKAYNDKFLDSDENYTSAAANYGSNPTLPLGSTDYTDGGEYTSQGQTYNYVTESFVYTMAIDETERSASLDIYFTTMYLTHKNYRHLKI